MVQFVVMPVSALVNLAGDPAARDKIVCHLLLQPYNSSAVAIGTCFEDGSHLGPCPKADSWFQLTCCMLMRW